MACLRVSLNCSVGTAWAGWAGWVIASWVVPIVRDSRALSAAERVRFGSLASAGRLF